MGHYNFHKDAYNSFIGSRALIKLLKEKYQARNITLNHDKKYDLSFELNDKIWLLELKEDIMYQTTGNIAIEIRNNGQPYGLSTTQSTIYCYKLGDDFYVIKPIDLKKNIKANRYNRTMGGDKNKSELILIPYKTFISLCKKLG